MKHARNDRSLVAWMLYASILLSLFACGIHHGQMSGLALSGLAGGYCGVDSESGAGIDPGGPDQKQQTLPTLSCPLCSSGALVLALNSHHWGMDDLPVIATSLFVVHQWPQPPPRYSWPSLNPRASPV